MESLFQLLTGTMIFKGMDKESIESLFRQKTFRLKHYEKGEYIAHSHDECTRLMIVISGSVRGEMTDFPGKTIADQPG